MAQKIAERLTWAVDTLNVQPADRLLEIGCGHGVAVSLVCDKLTSGTITALDRSETMIGMATKRNSACVASGKARFLTAALDKADFGGQTFNKIFAVHVNVFWMKPAKELAVIRKALTDDGSLFLFYQPLDVSKTAELIDKLTANLQANAFPNVSTLSADLPSGKTICIVARQ